MFIPKQFREDREEVIEDFLVKNSFATLISVDNGAPVVTHIPIEYINVNGVRKLIGHMAKGNPHWKTLDNATILAVFTGPQGYISSKWYDHENVPTWNYIAVHVRGTVKIISDKEGMMNILSYQLKKYEEGRKNPLQMSDLSIKFLEDEVKGVIAFEVNDISIEANFKLSQNRNQKNFENILTELENQGELMCPLSDEMKKQFSKIKKN